MAIFATAPEIAFLRFVVQPKTITAEIAAAVGAWLAVNIGGICPIWKIPS